MLLGKVTKVHGLRGEVKIFSYSGQPENFSGYKEIVLVDSAGNLICSRLLSKNSGSRERLLLSDLLRSIIEIRRKKLSAEVFSLQKNLLPDTDEDEYYWYQYEGKLVVDRAGRDHWQDCKSF